jgi:hypothetical protein
MKTLKNIVLAIIVISLFLMTLKIFNFVAWISVLPFNIGLQILAMSVAVVCALYAGYKANMFS